MRRLTVLGAAVVMLVSACTSGEGEQKAAPKVALDNATAKAPLPPPPPTDAGPGVRALASAGWVVETPPTKKPAENLLLGGANSHEVVGGQVVTVTEGGIGAYDAVTGKRRWHYRESKRRVRGYATTGGAIVALTMPGGELASVDRWVGLETATGRILWTSGDKGTPVSGTSRLMAGGGVVPVRPEPGSKGVVAIDARTGRTRWSQWALGGAACKNENPDLVEGDGTLIFVELSCKDGTHQTLALDPATGRERWRQAFKGEITVRRGVTLLSGDESKVISPDGRVLSGAPHGPRCGGGCPFAATGEHVGVAYELGTDDHRLLVINIRTGQATELTGKGPYEALTAAGGVFYGLRKTLAEPLLVSGLDVISPAAGDVRSLAVPPTVGHLDHSIGSGQVEGLHAEGERVHVTELLGDGAKLTWAIRAADHGLRGPPELGGVPASDWPDACALAPSFQEADYFREGIQDSRIGAVRLKRVACTITAKRGAFAPVEITIAWVAGGPDEAKGLIRVDEALAVGGPGDEAYRFKVSGAPSMLMRAGRYLVALAGDDDEVVRLAAGEIARTLRRRH